MEKSIHINCDMGEGLGNEPELMPYIHAANIACGGHAGDAEEIERVMLLAAGYEVEIGIHPSYPDRENFGRVSMEIEIEALGDALKKQFDLFFNTAEKRRVVVSHIKPHGALYHDLSNSRDMGLMFLEICQTYLAEGKIFGPPKSKLEDEVGTFGFSYWKEAFADRGYDKSGNLLSRKMEGAILHDAAAMAKQMNGILKDNRVVSSTGEFIEIEADTICVHGDHKNVIDNLRHIYQENGWKPNYQ